MTEGRTDMSVDAHASLSLSFFFCPSPAFFQHLVLRALRTPANCSWFVRLEAAMRYETMTLEPLAKFIERGEFSLCSRGRSGRRSGWRGPELGDAEYLIDRERQNAEHEVAFDLDRAA